MASGLDREIFEAASQRDPDDLAVDDVIREQQHDPQAPGPEEPPPPPPPAETPAEKQSGLLRALLDERDRRQDVARQLERYQTQERERQAREQRPALNERLFTDPEGTLNELRLEWTTPLEKQIAQLQLNQDFALAQIRHGDTFQKAWEAWVQRVQGGQDAATYFGVLNAVSPGEAMVQWYKHNSIVDRVGGDLDAYEKQVIEKYLAQQGRPRAPNGQFVPTARPEAPQRPPTSLSRMGSATSSRDDEDENDGSDAAIFAAARPSRRGER